MKKFLTISFLFALMLLVNCSKKAATTTTCKVCKVPGLGVDQQVIQKEVCTPDEEQAFRNANPGKTITCN